MCTLSIVSSPDGSALRLLMNRDEHRLRPVATPPAVHHTPRGDAVWPTDPVSGGTWMAVTDAGLALVVMNADGHRRSPHLLSRGTIVPLLADAHSVDDVLRGWPELDASAFAPFRLFVISRHIMAVCASWSRTPVLSQVGRARAFASSSLGDAQVERLRGALFASTIRSEADPWAAQTRFHRHAWPHRRHLSVLMSREEACTVSQTEVVITAHTVSLGYRPIVDGWLMGETRRALPIAAVSLRVA
jgi:hypothetical protein